MKDKKELRSHLLKKRQSLSKEDWQERSQKICKNLSQWQFVQKAEVILAFMSFKQEPDLSDLWQLFPAKIWGFSRCVGQELHWHQVDPLQMASSLEVGAYGILQPISSSPKIDLEHVDLILVPAIACDYRGYRLGYGGGFYDRFLVNQTGTKVGIIFSDTYVKALPSDDWDIPMKVICTDNGIIEKQ